MIYLSQFLCDPSSALAPMISSCVFFHLPLCSHSWFVVAGEGELAGGNGEARQAGNHGQRLRMGLKVMAIR